MLKSQRGATFIELLIVVIIAVAAFGLALVGLLKLAVISTNQTVEFSNMQNEASLIMRKLTREIQESNSVTIDPSNTDYMKLNRSSPPSSVEYETNANDNLIYTDEVGITSTIAENITFFDLSGQQKIHGQDYKSVRISLTKTSPKPKASPKDFTLTTSAYCRPPSISSTPVMLYRAPGNIIDYFSTIYYSLISNVITTRVII
ncbi:hypothetical protein ACFL0T_02275 [Candidatus Omnitrophota bacterium]